MLVPDEVGVRRFRQLRTELASADPQGKAEHLAHLARDVRMADARMINRAGLGHIGGDFSVIDILVTLYGAVLDVDPADPHNPERDRLVLSKGHTAGALYTTLALLGFFAQAELETFMAPLSALNGHPNRTEVPGV
jgi:transketolase